MLALPSSPPLSIVERVRHSTGPLSGGKVGIELTHQNKFYDSEGNSLPFCSFHGLNMQCGVSSTWIECPEFFHDFRLLRSAVILFRSGLNVIDGCVAGDEIEIESVGRSVGRVRG